MKKMLVHLALAGFVLTLGGVRADDKPDEANRDISKSKSQEVLDDTLMSKELKGFRAKFLSIKTKEEIDEALKDIELNYDKYPDDLKYVAVQLSLLRPFKSLVYRNVPLFTKTRVTHSMALTMVMQAAGDMRLYLPTEQWDAGFAYVTEPMAGTAPQFKNVADFQNFIYNEVRPAVLQAVERMSKINMDAAHPIIWDNKLTYGLGSFPDSLDRYRLVGNTERYYSLSLLSMGLHQMLFFCAYQMDHLPEVFERMGRIIGFDGFLLPDVEGSTSYRRTKEMRAQFPGDFVLRTARKDVVGGKSGKELMQDAWTALNGSVKFTRLTWEDLRSRPANDYNVLNSARIVPSRREIELTLNNYEALIKGEALIKSAVTDETVTVNLPELYNNPPRDLKELLPIGFEDKPQYKYFGKVKYRNYFWGRPVKWNLAAYKPYFPGLKSGEEVGKASRILSQAWGGAYLNYPLADLVN